MPDQGCRSTSEAEILRREEALRRWFIRDCDPIRREIDGLDIGWGGVQRWATARLPGSDSRWHLDFACGYGTFLAQLGWRFPHLQLVGLNIDFAGPHALAPALLRQAGVSERCLLVRADAREMPFPDAVFDSASCFLGLQDIQIGFGEEGVKQALREALRVVKGGGNITVIDELELVNCLFLERLKVVREDEYAPDVRWDRRTAEAVAKLYARGWAKQTRSGSREGAYQGALARMRADLERQLTEQGYFNPCQPIRMVVVERRG